MSRNNISGLARLEAWLLVPSIAAILCSLKSCRGIKFSLLSMLLVLSLFAMLM